jgi:hypothetical protein
MIDELETALLPVNLIKIDLGYVIIIHMLIELASVDTIVYQYKNKT